MNSVMEEKWVWDLGTFESGEKHTTEYSLACDLHVNFGRSLGLSI